MKNPHSQSPLVIAASLSIIASMLIALPAQADPDERAWRMARPVKCELIESGNDGVFLEPIVLVITSEKQWNDEMASLEDRKLLFVLPAPKAPAGVNWDREAVLLVAMGQLGELHCYAEIREVRRIGYRALCDVRIDVLPPPRSQTLTSPYYMTKFDRRGHVRSAAARYEYRYLGLPRGDVQVKYSNGDAFLKTDDDESTRKVTWGGVKSLVSDP